MGFFAMSAMQDIKAGARSAGVPPDQASPSEPGRCRREFLTDRRGAGEYGIGTRVQGEKDRMLLPIDIEHLMADADMRSSQAELH
jgi:hypothetical protein